MSAATASQTTSEHDRRRPGEADEAAEIGRDALAAAELEPDRIHVAEDRARRRRERRRRSERHQAKTMASVAFSASSTSVAAASPLRPVRRTLVAPMLPEPIERKSPAPASLVSTSPKGIDPRQ